MFVNKVLFFPAKTQVSLCCNSATGDFIQYSSAFFCSAPQAAKDLCYGQLKSVFQCSIIDSTGSHQHLWLLVDLFIYSHYDDDSECIALKKDGFSFGIDLHEVTV